MPPEVFVAVFVMADGKKMPTITTEQTFRAFIADPAGYERKRVERFNAKVPTSNRRWHVARGFRVERYLRAS